MGEWVAPLGRVEPSRRRRVLEGYAAAAEVLVPRYEGLSTPELLAVVAPVLPNAPAQVLDVGAGTGRDAAWFVDRGCSVLAVEPVRAFREAGALAHPGPGIEWLDDLLPGLPAVTARATRFDLVLLHGVWHHLSLAEQGVACHTLGRLTEVGGTLVVALRHGPGVPDRPCFEVPLDETIDGLQRSGFDLVLRESRESIQPANRASGVTWTWLALRRSQP